MTSVTIGIDPRIRARRVAVMRAAGRRRLRILLGVLALLALLAGAWGISRSPVLDVDHVEIHGVDAASTELIRQAAAVSPSTPLLDVDTGLVEARIERLPWVEEAAVERRWPGTISMTVVERAAVAVVPSGTGIALLDGNGVVIARESQATSTTSADLPVIDVPLSVAIGDVHLAAAPGLAVAAALTSDLEAWVEAIQVEGDQVGLDLVGDARVTMGPPVLLDDKVTALRAVLAGVDLPCLSEVDVTAPDQTTVRRDAACESVRQATDSDA